MFQRTNNTPLRSLWGGVQRVFQRRAGKVQRIALLGDGNGNINDSKQPWLVRVRELYADANGLEQPGPAFLVFGWAGNAYHVFDGSRVEIGSDNNGQLCVLGEHTQSTVQRGRNPTVLNIGDPRTKSASLSSFKFLLSHPVATGNTDSMLIAIRAGAFRDPLGQWQIFPGIQVDLTSYVPATSGYHGLVGLFLKNDNTITAIASTAKPDVVKLTHGTDLQEIYDSAPSNAMPIWAWRVTEGMTTITDSHSYQDMRPWMQTPDVHGFPSLIENHFIVPLNWHSYAPGVVTVTGGLTVIGTLTVDI